MKLGLGVLAALAATANSTPASFKGRPDCSTLMGWALAMADTAP